MHLGLRSEMIFHRAHGVVERHDGYWTICTPGNPTYFWGNCLVFDHAPRAGDAARWLALFERHIAQRQPASRHVALGWTEQLAGERRAFIDLGFEAQESVVMSTTAPRSAPAPRVAAALRALAPHDWPALIDLHVLTREPHHPEADYRRYAERSVAEWRSLSEAGQGGWRGAFVDGTLVAALGLYFEREAAAGDERLGRYQSVATHPDWRRRGLCRALVSLAGRSALVERRADRLVMVADAHDIARGIYASVGFEVVESWYGVQRVGY
ncbi:MAG: GNAT family N-acetyltransferase [Betaproteobacteria bacterium]